MPTSKTRATLRLIESLMPQHPAAELGVSPRHLFRIFLPDTGVPDVMPCECLKCRKARGPK